MPPKREQGAMSGVLGMSAAARLAIALIGVALIWIGVWWALA